MSARRADLQVLYVGLRDLAFCFGFSSTRRMRPEVAIDAFLNAGSAEQHHAAILRHIGDTGTARRRGSASVRASVQQNGPPVRLPLPNSARKLYPAAAHETRLVISPARFSEISIMMPR